MVVQMCYVGSREKGQEYLAAISSWDGEKCLLNEVDEKSFLHQQDSVAQVLRGKGASCKTCRPRSDTTFIYLKLDANGSYVLRWFLHFRMILSTKLSCNLQIPLLVAVCVPYFECL